MIMRELRRWAVYSFLPLCHFIFFIFPRRFTVYHTNHAQKGHTSLFFKEAYPILMIMIIIISNRTDFLVCFFFGCLKTTMMAMAITDSFHTRKFNWRRCDEEWNKMCILLAWLSYFLFYFFSLLVGHNRLWLLLSANIIQNAKLLYYRSTLWRRRRRRHMTIKNPFFLAFFSFSVHSSVVYLCPYIRLAPNYAAALSTLIIVIIIIKIYIFSRTLEGSSSSPIILAIFLWHSLRIYNEMQ